jgi:flagellar biosynthesis protein FlhF
VGEDSTECILAAAAARLGSGADVAHAGDAVRTALLDLIGDDGDDAPGERSTLVVGPAGAGKTTLVAKIAAESVGRGDEPVLVAADGESLGGEDQLQAVAAALGLPFETAFVPGRLEQAIERHGARRTFLVDTPGRSPFDGQGLEPMTSLAAALPDAEILLVLPAGGALDEIRSQVDAWAPLKPDRVVLTKLDELARPGRLVDVARVLALPIARVSFGRSARGTCATPRDPRVLARILGTELAVEMTA